MSRLRRIAPFAMAMAATSLLCLAFTPAEPSVNVSGRDLEAVLPSRIGDWSRVEGAAPVLAPAQGGESVAFALYRDDWGRAVTLLLAHAPPRGDALRLHRPETCYRANGFSVSSRVVADGRTRFVAERPGRREAVVYALRDGDRPVGAEAGRQAAAFLRGPGAAADGALVRVSAALPIGAEPESAFALGRSFLDAFETGLAPPTRALLFAER